MTKLARDDELVLTKAAASRRVKRVGTFAAAGRRRTRATMPATTVRSMRWRLRPADALAAEDRRGFAVRALERGQEP
jgi:hypothetical protein